MGFREGMEYKDGEIIVTFKKDAKKNEVTNLVESFGLKVGRWIGYSVIIPVEIGAEIEWKEKFEKFEIVRGVDLNWLRHFRPR